MPCPWWNFYSVAFMLLFIFEFTKKLYEDLRVYQELHKATCLYNDSSSSLEKFGTFPTGFKFQQGCQLTIFSYGKNILSFQNTTSLQNCSFYLAFSRAKEGTLWWYPSVCWMCFLLSLISYTCCWPWQIRCWQVLLTLSWG